MVGLKKIQGAVAKDFFGRVIQPPAAPAEAAKQEVECEAAAAAAAPAASEVTAKTRRPRVLFRFQEVIDYKLASEKQGP
jgi:hypothetical protein